MSGSKGGKRRMFMGVEGRRPDNKRIRQKDAEARNAAWAALSAEDQLKVLDARLGNGMGAAKQRKRLQSKLAAS